MSNKKECRAFKDSMSLSQIDRALEEIASSGWRLPEAKELSEVLSGEEVELPLAIGNIPTQWYWSNTIASESQYEGIREGVNPNDKETRVVVKYHGRSQDSSILGRYGVIFVRD